MIKKSIVRFIEDKFSFLIEYEFKVKKYQKGSEIEFCYFNEIYKIDILSYEGIDDQYKKTLSVDLIISDKTVESNIIKRYDIFGIEKINELKSNISNKNHYDTISLYSEFIKKNIFELVTS